MGKKTGHINIVGTISSMQDSAAEDFGEVNVKQVKEQIEAAGDVDELVIHIHSPGGEVLEGFAIHDVIRGTGKKIITSIEGLCGSIATVIALAGDERRMTPNSEFFIHNPWTWPMPGNAEEIKKEVAYLETLEKKILDFYVSKTGATADQIKPMMDEETSLTADNALELKFITTIAETVKAMALSKKTIKLSKTHKKEKAMYKNLKKAFAAFSKVIKDEFKVEDNITMNTSDGTTLEVITEADVAAVGDAVQIEGAPAPDAEYPMPDGSTIVTADGKISEIKPAEDEETVDSLTEKVKALEEKLEEKDAKLTEQEEGIKAMAEQIEKWSELISEGNPGAKARKGGGGKAVRTSKSGGANPARGKTIEEIKKERADARKGYDVKNPMR